MKVCFGLVEGFVLRLEQRVLGVIFFGFFMAEYDGFA